MTENYTENENGRYGKVSKFKKDAILRMIKKQTGNILDVGCGPGVLGEIIKKETGAKVYGLDSSPEFIALARLKLDQALYFNAAEELDHWPEALKMIDFDFILITDVLEHLPQPEMLLSGIKNLMSEKTAVIMTVPNVLFWKNRLKILFGRFDYTTEGLLDKTHLHFFTWRSLKNLLAKTGFLIIETIHHFPTRGTRFFGLFFPGLFGYKFIIKCKKI